MQTIHLNGSAPEMSDGSRFDVVKVELIES